MAESCGEWRFGFDGWNQDQGRPAAPIFTLLVMARGTCGTYRSRWLILERFLPEGAQKTQKIPGLEGKLDRLEWIVVEISHFRP